MNIFTSSNVIIDIKNNISTSKKSIKVKIEKNEFLISKIKVFTSNNCISEM